MKIKILLGMLVILSSSCTNLEKIKKIEINGASFNDELAKDYVSFAKHEADEYHWSNAEHFAEKAVLASKHKKVLPEDLKNKSFKASNLLELTAARVKLEKILTDSNKSIYPKETASAQYYFDCWVEEQKENWQIDEINSCKKGFNDTLTNFSQLNKDDIVIYFDFNKYNIEKSQEIILLKIKEDAIKKTYHKIIISGYTDNTGRSDYNNTLSKKRAVAVKNYLKNLGIKSNILITREFGNRNLAVKTVHGIKERLNRRVVIETR